MPYGYASDPYTPTIINPLLEPWRWKHFPELEGKGIRDIVEAPDNKVWASCNEGVLEYDGYHWKTHDTRSGLPTSPMEQLLASDEGVMYATSTRGIFRYDGRRWTHFFQAPENFPFTFLNIRQLSDGSIIACADRGIIHFDRQARPGFYSSPAKIQVLQAHFPQIEWIALPEAALNEAGDLLNTSDALETGDGFIWFALTTQMESGKLLRFPMSDLKHRRVTTYKVFEGTAQFPLGEGQKLLLAADKKLWVVNSSSNKGVHVFDGQTWEHLQPGRQFGRDEYMTDIVQSANGAIWIASMASIFTYASGKWQMYKAPEFPIPANRVMLQNSRDDKLWVAGYKSKVLLIDFSPEQWATYARLNFQCEVSPGEQWFLEADNRVVHRKGNDWQAYDTQDGLIDAPIRVIATSKGQIWAAGSHKGVAATALLKNGVWERHLHPRLSWGIDYRSVFEARDGALWFGGAVDAEQKDGFLSGLLHLPDPTAAQLEWIHHVYGENGLKQANVYGIAQSPDGRIWIGGSKLYYYDGSTWKYLPDERLQQYVNVVYSTEDRLIVGSRFYGVFIFDGENWENHTTASGLSGNTIISIDVLPDSSIIVATENDICKYDGRSWTRN